MRDISTSIVGCSMRFYTHFSVPMIYILLQFQAGILSIMGDMFTLDLVLKGVE